MLSAIFWLSLFGASFSYAWYPLLLLLMPGRGAPMCRRGGDLPRITVIITAHNERERIATKLHNTLELRYPRENLEIIVASDASDDGTDDVVRSFADQGVRLVRAQQRQGKEHAQGLAVAQARGDILVFSDVATRITADSLMRIAYVFQNLEVGAVSSEDRFVTPDGRLRGEGLYVRYEMWLRRLESDVHSLVGLSGSFFAARREICRPWDESVPSDFNIALNCIRQDYIAVADPELLGYYATLEEDEREYQRKLRTVIRGMTALARQTSVLNPFRYGFFSVQLWGHKIMRWAVPWFLLALFAVSILLAETSWLYTVALALQFAFYALVLLGWAFRKLRRLALIRVPYFFVQVNVAIAHATIAFLLGRRVTVWQPSRR